MALVHLVGVVGFFVMPGAFALLVPLHLLFCFGVWLTNQPRWSRRLSAWLVLCGVAGFGAEVIGVKTSLLFGSYVYGDMLGPLLFDVPLMMAVNWALMASLAANVSAELRAARGWGPVRSALVGAALLTVLDMFLEPFAVRYRLWSWEGGAVPVTNYVGWAFVAFTLLLPYHWTRLGPSNPVSGWLFALLLGFFSSSALLGTAAS